MSFKNLKFASVLVLSVLVAACASTPEAARNTAACDTAQKAESQAAVCLAPAPAKEPDHCWHQSDRGERLN